MILAPSVRPSDVKPAACERAAEDHRLRVLTDVDEAAGPDDPVAEAADIDVAFLIDLGEGQKRELKPAAIIEVELIGLVDNRLIIAARADFVSRCGRAADQALLVR